MVIANKAVLSTFGYSNHMVLLLFQTSMTFGLTMLWAKLGYLKLEPFNTDLAARWLPVNLFFLAMLFSSYMSLKLLSVPMVTIFKNLANCAVLAGDYFFFGERISVGILGSLGLMVTGAVLSGLSDVSFNFAGYLWMFVNCLTTAGYLLYMRYVMQTTTLSKAQMAYYNSLLGMPMITVAAVLLGELPSALWAPQMQVPGFLAAAAFSGCVGFFLSLASLWCIDATSPTTYSMVGAFNKVPVAILGVILFDNPVTFRLAIFITMGIMGGILFSYVKAKEKSEKQRTKLREGRSSDEKA